MHEVESFLEGDEFQTDVWAATERVLVQMLKLARKKRDTVVRFQGLVRRCATVGFSRSPKVVRHEWSGVYAIGDRFGPLLRAAGFYCNEGPKQTFILMDFYVKPGQELPAHQRERINEVVRIKDAHDWVKV